ncbi:MAG TPA: DUF4143 domain-containing protein, partial [Candidatus Gracilibacteria bacterium]|nr:DUF4143 domain-containing protein [Candidatus Gracilibacteria bacterium]
LNLKIIVDQIPDISVIVTGSSAFELSGQIGEPLTGRKTTLNLYPIAQLELNNVFNTYDLKEKIEDYMIFGGYPALLNLNSKADKIDYLSEMLNAYLLKDILELEKVKSSKVLLDLLRLVAFQVGSEVSISELAKNLGIDSKTVARYLDLFEKSFIIYNLRGFSRNLRSEIVKKGKYYFYDNGIMNAIIANFNPLNARNDVGILFENWIFMERLKKRSYHKFLANIYFWRTWEQNEIDLIEEHDGLLNGYEFKWKKEQYSKKAQLFLDTYPQSSLKLINQNNYLDFVL